MVVCVEWHVLFINKQNKERKKHNKNISKKGLLQYLKYLYITNINTYLYLFVYPNNIFIKITLLYSNLHTCAAHFSLMEGSCLRFDG